MVADEPWLGKKLSGGRYHVVAKLGEGGMGSVYRAQDVTLGTEVVIKLPLPALLQEGDFANRFAREVRSLVRLVHPHIVRVLDVGTKDGIPFAVMQHLAGGTLRDRQKLGADGNPLPMSLKDISFWLKDVADALDFIHQQHYVHRDVKPDNILFDEHGNVYLSDFGVAKALGEKGQKCKTMLTQAGLFLGTPHYMAPEMLLGQPFDGRADQYALAVMLHELLTGRRPFDGPTPAAIFTDHVTKEPPPANELIPSIPKGTAAAVQKALQKEPEDRYPTCAAFARAALQGLLAHAHGKKERRAGVVKVTCSGCQNVVWVPVGDRGKRLRCPSCNEPILCAPKSRSVEPARPALEAEPENPKSLPMSASGPADVQANPDSETSIQDFTSPGTVPAVIPEWRNEYGQEKTRSLLVAAMLIVSTCLVMALIVFLSWPEETGPAHQTWT